MSTYDRYEPGGPGIGTYLGLFVLLGVVGVAMMALIGPAIAPFADALDSMSAISVPEIWHDPNKDANHAFQRHGTVVFELRLCVKDKGAYQVWRNQDKQRFYFLCQLPDGRWGFVEAMYNAIVERWEEVTTFVPRDGTWNNVIRYLQDFSSKFNGPFPW